MINLIIHASEAGIATQIKAMEGLLDETKYNLSFDLSGPAKNILQKRPKMNLEAADLVICGFDDIKIDLTSTLLRKANKLNIPTIGILDTWKGIDRFFYPDSSIRPLSDILLIMDSFSEQYLIGRGIPESKLKRVSNFALDEIKKTLGRKSKSEVKVVKEKLDIFNQKPTLLFFSEPISFGFGRQISLIESETIETGVDLRGIIEKKYAKDFHLLLKTHPLEKAVEFPNWVNANQLSLLDSLVVADKVVGLSSTPIFYASNVGIEVVNVEGYLINWEPSKSNMPPILWNQINSLYRTKSEDVYSRKIIKNYNNDLPTIIEELIVSSTKLRI